MSPISQGTAGGLSCHHIREHLQTLYQLRNRLLTELLVLFEREKSNYLLSLWVNFTFFVWRGLGISSSKLSDSFPDTLLILFISLSKIIKERDY